jgi:hypothetical protein
MTSYLFIALSIKQGALRPTGLTVSLRFHTQFIASEDEMLFPKIRMLTLVFSMFPRHCAGGVHQFMYMDNFVDLLDNDSVVAASASTLVAAASVAAAEAGVQA